MQWEKGNHSGMQFFRNSNSLELLVSFGLASAPPFSEARTVREVHS